MHFDEYPCEVRPLGEEDGGGFLATFQDLPGLMGDGETPEEAIADARAAFSDWMAVWRERGFEPPAPGRAFSGQFRTRIPKSLHAELDARAKAEGVSLNTLVVSLLSRGLGEKGGHAVK